MKRDNKGIHLRIRFNKQPKGPPISTGEVDTVASPRHTQVIWASRFGETVDQHWAVEQPTKQRAPGQSKQVSRLHLILS